MSEDHQTKVTCPKCGSDQITAIKKGFSGKKAVAGAVLTGGIGLLAGTIGSNKIKVACLACGNTWDPVDKVKDAQRELDESKKRLKETNDQLKNMNAENKAVDAFKKSYEAGDKENAFELLKQNMPTATKYIDADDAYHKIKKGEEKFKIGCIAALAIGLIIALWYFLR